MLRAIAEQAWACCWQWTAETRAFHFLTRQAEMLEDLVLARAGRRDRKPPR